MIYEIEQKTDLQYGISLTVKVEEGDIDKKAYLTLIEDTPSYILPFKCRVVDGIYEFTYKLDGRGFFKFEKGSYSVEDYISMWEQILFPLKDSQDYFMSSTSFVFDYDYLFYDMATKSVSYLYVPSTKEVSSLGDIKQMVRDVEKNHKVNDIKIENEFLRAINDFNVGEFIDKVNSYKNKPQAASPSPNIGRPASEYNPIPSFAKPQEQNLNATPNLNSEIGNSLNNLISQIPRQSQRVEEKLFAAPATSNLSDDIVLNFGASRDKKAAKPAKEEKKKSAFSLGSSKKDKPKKEKPVKEKEKKSKDFLGGIFGKKDKDKGEGISQGAVGDYYNSHSFHPSPQLELSRNISSQPQMNSYNNLGDDKTEIIVEATKGPRLRYIGSQGHPPYIPLNLEINGSLSIGRVDNSGTMKKADFEFDAKTKAVSRNHAIVGRDANGYFIVDRGSSAGTFVDNQRLYPNSPFILRSGARVSFGNLGADYVFEE